jgi:hypothetical protein
MIFRLRKISAIGPPAQRRESQRALLAKRIVGQHPGEHDRRHRMPGSPTSKCCGRSAGFLLRMVDRSRRRARPQDRANRRRPGRLNRGRMLRQGRHRPRVRDDALRRNRSAATWRALRDPRNANQTMANQSGRFYAVANQRRVRLAERWRGDAGEHLSRREDSEDGRRRRPNRMANAAREAVMLTVDEVTQIYRGRSPNHPRRIEQHSAPRGRSAGTTPRRRAPQPFDLRRRAGLNHQRFAADHFRDGGGPC